MDQLIDRISQIVSPLLAEALAFVPPVDSPLYLPMLGGLVVVALLLLLLLVRVRRKRTNAHASRVFGREVTFEDISAETAGNASAAASSAAAPANPAIEVAKPAAAEMDPAENAEAQPTGFTFFKRKSAATEPRSAPAHDMSSGGDANGADAADAAGDDAVLAGLEQEMLATRQLYLDGMISKEVYVSETRALYQKAQTRMT
ncbi:MAG: hypothetical protein CMH56_11355 [Myxococcales bacterium]|nr:hypothetical protein [Myxococcales bacterium]